MCSSSLTPRTPQSTSKPFSDLHLLLWPVPKTSRVSPPVLAVFISAGLVLPGHNISGDRAISASSPECKLSFTALSFFLFSSSAHTLKPWCVYRKIMNLSTLLPHSWCFRKLTGVTLVSSLWSHTHSCPRTKRDWIWLMTLEKKWTVWKPALLLPTLRVQFFHRDHVSALFFFAAGVTGANPWLPSTVSLGA